MIDKTKKILEAKQQAILNGGICLSDKYINNKEKLEWKCSNSNHPSWFSSFSTVVNLKCWCPICGIKSNSKKRKHTKGLEIAQKYAQDKGGSCLSTEYIGSRAKLEWKCSNLNHSSWFASFDGVVNNKSWCPPCGIINNSEKRKIKNGLEQAKLHAITQGGSCLSTEYIASRDKLEWKCSNSNHSSWFASFDSVINNNRWCVHCANDKNFTKWRTEGLIGAHAYAKSRGGLCLSTEFLNGNTKIEWKCSNPDHSSWFGSYQQVTSKKSWCARCKGESAKEFKVRNILNYLFDTDFINTRTLSWNINPNTNRNLELDGYCDNLKIAFEFQGDHHTKLAFRNTQNKLYDIQEKDKIKKQNCINNNVKLIIIHEIKKQNFNDFYKEILKGIEQADLSIEEDRKNNILKLKELYHLYPVNDKQEKYLKEAKEYAFSRNGQCLSTKYINSTEKLEWKCSNINHPTWFTTFHSVIKNKSWCKHCSFKNRKNNKQDIF